MSEKKEPRGGDTNAARNKRHRDHTQAAMRGQDYRVPPQDIDAEQAMLGAMLLDKRCIVDVGGIVAFDHFYRLDHRALFEVLVDLHTDGKPIDIIIVEDELRRREQLEKVGGRDYIIELVNSVPSAANATYYAGLIHETYKRRQAVTLACKLEDAAYDGNGEYPTILSETCERLGRLETDNVKRRNLQATPIVELLSEPEQETEWLVDGLLPAGGFSLLASKPKVGKTTFARCCALAVARNERFLGRACHGGVVLYLGLEDKRSETTKHFRLLGASNEPLHVATEIRNHATALAGLASLVRETKAVLTIVDTLARLIRCEDFNDYAIVTRALEPLTELARETGCHVMALHHAGKDGNRDDGDSPLGSTALFGSVDTLLTLKRTNRGRVLSTRQRYCGDIEPTILTFDPESKRIDLGGTVATVAQADLAQEIMGVLESATEPMTKDEIRESVGGKTVAVGKAVDSLFVNDQVVRIGEGKRGNPYRFRSHSAPLKGGMGTESGNGDGPPF